MGEDEEIFSIRIHLFFANVRIPEQKLMKTERF